MIKRSFANSMTDAETPDEWRLRAIAAAQPMADATDRYFSIEGGQGPSALAALDELVAAGTAAHHWLVDNPTSEYELRNLLQRYISAYTEMADVMRSSGNPAELDERAVRARLNGLLDEIRTASEALEQWKS